MNNFELADNELALWVISLDQPESVLTSLSEILTPHERERADRFRSLPARRQFVIGRSSLRRILSQYLGQPASNLTFETAPNGKPFLAKNTPINSLEFNLSHSGNMAAIAFSRHHEVGIDIEQVRPMDNITALVNRFFSLSERAEFAELNDSLKLAGFFRTWTRKEAFIKATGQGLSRSLDTFDVGVHPDSPPGLIRVGDDPAEPGRWSMFDFTPGNDFFGAVAVAGTKLKTTHHWFDPGLKT